MSFSRKHIRGIGNFHVYERQSNLPHRAISKPRFIFVSKKIKGGMAAAKPNKQYKTQTHTNHLIFKRLRY